MTHALKGEKLLTIAYPDITWKQVYVSGDKHPIYFDAELSDEQIVEALAEVGVDVGAYQKALS
jgi:hypothetical protein